MPKDTVASKVFDLPVRLEPGQVNTLSFAQDNIAAMRLTPAQELEIVFRDGSKVLIENFQELVNSAQSCGRDTLIQLSDSTIIYPEELAQKLAGGPVDFAATDANGEAVVNLSEPPAGQVVERDIQPGQEYKLGFDLDRTVSAAQAGQNLVLTFKDGGVLVLKNYFTAQQSELPPAMTLADGSAIDSQALLTSCKLVQVPSVAELVADGVPAPKDAVVADVEPAAGGAAKTAKAEPKAEKVAAIEPAAGDEAQALANIEPAAGAAGGAQIGGRGGYGFSSEPSSTPFGGETPIGAIGATSLAYNANFINPNNITGLTTQTPPDSQPILESGTSSIQEITLGGVSGTVTGNFGTDGPGVFGFNDSLTVSGSFAGSSLTSNGTPVTIVRTGDTWTGTANGQTVFTLSINPTNGAYEFIQSLPLDHADATDPQDVITFQFGVTGTDNDGDVATTSITINVRDDGPVAVNDDAGVGSDPLTVGGNVLANDTVGSDGEPRVISVSFNGTSFAVPQSGTASVVGAHGTLVIAADGNYTYTSNNSSLGTDVFTYTMRDYDGDTSTANLSVAVEDLDTIPVLTNAQGQVDETAMGPTTSASGTLTANFGVDGPGTFVALNTFNSDGSRLNNSLTSNGVPVAVTLVGNQYIGKAGNDTVFTLTLQSNGSYSFVLSKPLDHADGANPNDVINLKFDVAAVDSDGDQGPGTLTIKVLDDAPVAVDDVITLADNDNGSIGTGNIVTNDTVGQDVLGSVTKVTFGTTTVDVPANGNNVTIAGTYGTLTINKTGAYTFTPNGAATGVDRFTYTLSDRDGDTSVANLSVTVNDIDDRPIVHNVSRTVDETNLDRSGTQTLTGRITTNFGNDGPGTVTPTGSGSFAAGGSLANGQLTSCGKPVVVSLAGNQYIGKVGNDTAFTLTINQDGTYTFKEFMALDHANKSDPNDNLTLRFGFTATDRDGDSTNGTITVNVRDDGPTARDDVNLSVGSSTNTATGNVLTNDSAGADGNAKVTKVTFGTTVVDVPATGNITINGAFGNLTIDANGVYTYVATGRGQDEFRYTMRDCDGDTSTAKLIVAVCGCDDKPTIENVSVCIDETALPTGAITITGNTQPNFFGDGPGTVKGTGASTFEAGGVMKNNTLTSNGVAVAVTLNAVTNTYVGMAGSTTVFTMKINNDGTFAFTQFAKLDHGASNASTGTITNATTNEEITLAFGVTATDKDGDNATGKITVCIKDDAPIARDDCYDLNLGQTVATGNVLGNDTIGADFDTNVVVWANFKGVKYTIPNGGSTTIIGENGTLVLNSNGQFTYTVKNGATGIDEFSYTICDTDQDISTAKLCLDANNPLPPPPPPVIDAPPNCVLEDGKVEICLTVRPQGGDGDERLTVTISGFKPGWAVDTSQSGGTYNASTGVWTITLAAGQVLTRGPDVSPPRDSDVDLTNLIVKATLFDPDSGQSSSAETVTKVIVDAVADRPNINTEDVTTTSHVVGLTISASLNDRDGSEVLREIRIMNAPTGATLNKGSFDPTTGIWTLTPAQLKDLKITVPQSFKGSFDLVVTAVSEERNLSGEECYTSNNTAFRSDILKVTIDDCGCHGNPSLPPPELEHITTALSASINHAEGDVLDISSLLQVDNSITQAINDFVYTGATSIQVQNVNVNVANDTGVTSAVTTQISIQLDDQTQQHIQQSQSGFA
jgi:T1SS-143 domain-containing protein